MKIRRPWKLKAQGSPVTEAETHVEKKKTTTITSESHELFIVRRGTEQRIRMWCPDCAGEVDMLKPEEAAAIANVDTRTIYRWIEADQIHHSESGEGNVLVCPRQLFP